jgi:hypothetical protein
MRKDAAEEARVQLRRIAGENNPASDPRSPQPPAMFYNPSVDDAESSAGSKVSPTS